jgi:hypothetical protein
VARALQIISSILDKVAPLAAQVTISQFDEPNIWLDELGLI